MATAFASSLSDPRSRFLSRWLVVEFELRLDMADAELTAGRQTDGTIKKGAPKRAFLLLKESSDDLPEDKGTNREAIVLQCGS